MTGLHKAWTDEELNQLAKLYNENVPQIMIAEQLGKTHVAVKNMLRKKRKEWGLQYRDVRTMMKNKGDARVDTAFDKQWKGGVPFGHWAITKAWSKSA